MAAGAYTIQYKKSVEKDLRKLTPAQLSGIVAKILALADDPYPNGSTKLRGSSNLFRIRYADYRIMYQIQAHKLVVIVIKIGHRREVYREL